MRKGISFTPRIAYFAFFLIAIIFLITVVYYNLPGPSSTQLIVANDVITHPMLSPSWLDTLWYEGVSVRQHPNGISDNPDILVTVVNSDEIEVNVEKDLMMDKYPSNQTIHNGNSEVTNQLFPLNYLGKPMYFVRNSIVTIILHIYMLSSVDIFHKATLYIFNSDKELQMFLSTKMNGRPIQTVDASDIASKMIMHDYNVEEDGYLFFVLVSNTSSNSFTLFSNITSELNSYVIAGDKPKNSSSGTLGRNTSVLFNFSMFSPPKKMIFLYAHPVGDFEFLHTHLGLAYHSRSWFRILVVFFCCLLVVCFLCVCIYTFCRYLQQKKRRNNYERL